MFAQKPHSLPVQRNISINEKINWLEVVSCASKERCVEKIIPQSTAYKCPGHGLSIHALCGHLHEDASIY